MFFGLSVIFDVRWKIIFLGAEKVFLLTCNKCLSREITEIIQQIIVLHHLIDVVKRNSLYNKMKGIRQEWSEPGGLFSCKMKTLRMIADTKKFHFCSLSAWHWLQNVSWKRCLEETSPDKWEVLAMEKLLIYGFLVELLAFASIKWTLNGDWNDKHFFFVERFSSRRNFSFSCVQIFKIFHEENSSHLLLRHFSHEKDLFLLFLYPSGIRVCALNKNWHEMNGC